MGHEMVEFIGKRFGKLTVSAYLGKENKKHKWLCICDCGKKTVVAECNLKDGHTRSCGCIRNEKISKVNVKHKEVGSHLYTIWADMKARCKNPKSNSFYLYGGRGISVCDEWNDYCQFRLWARSSGFAESLSLDRIDPNGNYEPSNCRWVSPREQQRNKRNTMYLTIQGITKPAKTWCEESGARYKTVFYRKRYAGWNDYDALYGRENNAS